MKYIVFSCAMLAACGEFEQAPLSDTNPTCIMATHYDDTEELRSLILREIMSTASEPNAIIRNGAFYGPGDGKVALEIAATCEVASEHVRAIMNDLLVHANNQQQRREIEHMREGWYQITQEQYEYGDF